MRSFLLVLLVSSTSIAAEEAPGRTASFHYKVAMKALEADDLPTALDEMKKAVDVFRQVLTGAAD